MIDRHELFILRTAHAMPLLMVLGRHSARMNLISGGPKTDGGQIDQNGRRKGGRGRPSRRRRGRVVRGRQALLLQSADDH